MRILEQQHDPCPEQTVAACVGCDSVLALKMSVRDDSSDYEQQAAACGCSSSRAPTAAPASKPPATSASVRWRQLRKMIQQLTRGMRKYPAPASIDAGTAAVVAVAALTAAAAAADTPSEVEAGASMLHKDFWLEALDEQHRYGFHLRAFHRAWKDAMAHSSSAQDSADGQNASFFYWLDQGDGKALELPECSRQALQSMRVQYCDAEARKVFQVQFTSSQSHQRPVLTTPADDDAAELTDNNVVLAEYAASGQLVHTDELSKWIFVVDLRGTMFVGRKRKGAFHHSSFVSGAPIFAAGKIMIKHGRILAIEPHSGHFKPTLRNLTALCHMLRAQSVSVEQIAFVRPKKWSCAWPFPELPPHLAGCELEDLASDTDYYKSDSEEQE